MNRTGSGTAKKLAEVIDVLPYVAQPPRVVTPQGDKIQMIEDSLDSYVEPTFEVLSESTEARLLVVEAAGAVGKSILAVALAQRLGWPLVRAEKAQVGDYTLSGLLQSSLGMDSDYLAKVATGQAGVIVDALDEGHLKAGTPNFLAFLRNIADVAGGTLKNAEPPRLPSIVLLSRLDTSEFMQIHFDELEIPVNVYRLSFFDRPDAERFIELHLKNRYNLTGEKEYNVALAWPTPFRRLRDARFLKLMSVLLRKDEPSLDNDWLTGKEFLGYAPVLIAVAESLAVSNPSAEVAAASDGGADGAFTLLADIVDHILERERLKVQDNLGNKLQAMLPASVDASIDTESLYGKAEQIARLTAYIYGAAIRAPLPASLPPEVRSDYERHVGPFVADHPFVRGREFASSVFSDFIAAQIVRDLSVQASVETPSLDPSDIGPFFLEFLARSFPDESKMTVKESILPLLISSWEAQRELVKDAADSATIIFQGSHGQAIFPRRDGSILVFAIEEGSGAFQIQRIPSRVALISDSGLILGEMRKTLQVGEGSFIAAPEVELQSDSLTIIPSDGAERSVTLVAENLTANYLMAVAKNRADLRIHCTNPPPKLRDFLAPRSGISSVQFSDYVGLRAILTSFRSTVHRGLSVDRTLLDRILRGDSFKEAVLARLIETGVIIDNNDWLQLDLTALGSVGFNLNQIKDGEPSQAVLAFLASCR